MQTAHVFININKETLSIHFYTMKKQNRIFKFILFLLQHELKYKEIAFTLTKLKIFELKKKFHYNCSIYCLLKYLRIKSNLFLYVVELYLLLSLFNFNFVA